MDNLERLYKNLEKYSDFDVDKNPEKFLETIDKIVILGNPLGINKLLYYFKDDSDYGWVLESLLVALESYPDNVYVPTLIKSVPFMLQQSPRWLLSMTYGVLNNAESLQFFRKSMHLIPQQSMIELLDLVARESEHHRELCKELKQELLKKH